MLYMVASIVGAASGGPLKAALGPRKGYVLGGLLFLTGSAACGASPTMLVVLIARTVQGYGGGLLLAQSMGLISELYPQALRTRILATVSGVWGVAALLGPLVGGIFAEFDWWRGAFWASTPIILWFTARAWQTLPRATAVTAVPPFPFRRIALLAFGVLCAGAADQIPNLAAQGLLLVAALALTVQAFRLDGAATNRLFPPRPLSMLTPVGTAYWIMFLFSMTHTSIGIYLPLALQSCTASARWRPAMPMRRWRCPGRWPPSSPRAGAAARSRRHRRRAALVARRHRPRARRDHAVAAPQLPADGRDRPRHRPCNLHVVALTMRMPSRASKA
jgi:MFS family permease